MPVSRPSPVTVNVRSLTAVTVTPASTRFVVPAPRNSATSEASKLPARSASENVTVKASIAAATIASGRVSAAIVGATVSIGS
jgi:hypothetical protein